MSLVFWPWHSRQTEPLPPPAISRVYICRVERTEVFYGEAGDQAGVIPRIDHRGWNSSPPGLLSVLTERWKQASSSQWLVPIQFGSHWGSTSPVSRSLRVLS